MICRICGFEIPEGNSYCPYCLHKIKDGEAEKINQGKGENVSQCTSSINVGKGENVLQGISSHISLGKAILALIFSTLGVSYILTSFFLPVSVEEMGVFLVVTFLFSFFSLVFSILGLIFGILSIANYKNNLHIRSRKRIINLIFGIYSVVSSALSLTMIFVNVSWLLIAIL